MAQSPSQPVDDLAEINLADPDRFTEGVPHHWFRALRERAPVYWHPGNATVGNGFWCVTRYEDVKEVSRNPQVYSSERGGTNIPDMPEEGLQQVRAIMLNMDPPRHVQYRRLVQRGFTPRMIENLRPHIFERAKQIVDGVIERGRCEFVSEVAAELPLQMICEMVGVPQEDRKRIFDLTNQLVGFDDPDCKDRQAEGMSAAIQMFMYANQLATRFRDEPDDNLTSVLLRAEVDGERLSELDFCSFFLLLCTAGSETTRSVTANGMRLLLENPDVLAELQADASLIPTAVEEFLRYDPAVNYFRRTTTQDTELRGQKLREGDKVVVWYPAANRDPSVFPDPDRLDIRRSPNDHLSFGIGEHFCLGTNLARLELIAIFEQVIGRLKNPEFDGPPRRMRSNFLNSLKEMNITFTPQA